MLTDEGEKDEEQEKGRIAPKEKIEGSIENGDDGNNGCKKDLSREDSVDFTDETPTELIITKGETWVEGFTRFDIEFFIVFYGCVTSFVVRLLLLWLIKIHHLN